MIISVWCMFGKSLSEINRKKSDDLRKANERPVETAVS